MHRRPSGLTTVAIAGVLALAPASAALAGPHGSHGHSSTHATGGHHGRAAQKFTATGTVTTVAGDQLTLTDRGGSRDLHGTDVTVTVPDGAHIRRGGPALLVDIQPGDHVSVHGQRTEEGLVARHVHASVPDTEDTTEDTTEDGTDDGTVDDGTTGDGTVDDGTAGDDTTTDGGTTV